MHVAIDATPLTLTSGGLARYTNELTRALSSAFPEDRYTLMSDQPFRFEPAANIDVLPGPATGLSRRWWAAGIPMAMHRVAADLFHGTDFAVPYLPLWPSVMTVHDLSPWMEAGWHTGADRVRSRTPRLLRLGLATMVITVSEAVRRQVIEYFQLHPSRVIATPLAAQPAFQPSDEPKGNYFLFVGTLEPRKNLAMLVDAWRPVYAGHGVELWIAGRARHDAPRLPQLPGLRLLGEVPEAKLPLLYRQALAFVYPSLYEGFGLPVLEAMQSGATVITSTDPAITEVSRDAAVLLDPNDPRAWTEALQACASGALTLREPAIRRAREFSWTRTARATREVYQEALARRGN